MKKFYIILSLLAVLPIQIFTAESAWPTDAEFARQREKVFIMNQSLYSKATSGIFRLAIDPVSGSIEGFIDVNFVKNEIQKLEAFFAHPAVQSKYCSGGSQSGSYRTDIGNMVILVSGVQKMAGEELPAPYIKSFAVKGFAKQAAQLSQQRLQPVLMETTEDVVTRVRKSYFEQD